MTFTRFKRSGAALTGLAGILAVSAHLTFTASADNASAENRVVITDFVGTLEIREGGDLSYDLDMGKGIIGAPELDASPGILTVRGDANTRIETCYSRNDDLWLGLRDGHKARIEDYPLLTITMPSNASIDLEMLGGIASISESAAMVLEFNGCGDVGFDDVAGPASVALYGSGDVVGGDAASLDLVLKGSGDVVMDDISGETRINVEGSGDVELGKVLGKLDVVLSGSADISVDEAAGATDLDLSGSGDIEIDGGEIEKLSISLDGSGDISFNGTAKDVSVLLNGSGDVYVARSDGDRVVERHGSGDVRIGSWRSDD